MEYRDSKFLDLLQTNGTLCHRSCPGTSQQNGRAERKHRHILETIRALLIAASYPKRFWGEAALTATYIINRFPSPIIGNQSPYERLYGAPPNYSLLKVFDCVCFVLLQPHDYTKLEPQARLCCFLGYGIKHKEVLSNADGYYLSQAKYASDLLARAGLIYSKVTSILLELNAKLTPLDGAPLKDATLYRQLYMSAPRSPNYAAVLHIHRYIKGTLFHGLHFSAHSSIELRAFSDADWAGDPTDRHFTTAQRLNTMPLLILLKKLLGFIGFSMIWVFPHSGPTPLACDNSSAIQITHNDVFHECTKHIEVNCHFICQHITQGTIVLRSISSLDQPADIFTKSHHRGRFRNLVSKLKITSTPPS
ncbi:Retrovirus-related Pol polyprotein from transposon TNT 1-94 [Melia azedarach]|uniref:Retrovirus-related Pol polyprotein from transposon TNT 1-94 n=1 Tax=Melia azedarach TaxID=155640 RepID=A0ACC1Y117_MELAZ|nr:Retrovirus-related Pol polyprotein from transposon TNT 1-94 [Melia azedarach]